MLLNLRAMPEGLESHRKFLETEVGEWLGLSDQADVTFICTNTSPSNTSNTTVRLAAHQAVLAPLSPVLREIFHQHSCGHRKEMVDITMETDPEVMKAVLSLVYRGATTLSTKAVEELKSIVKMLNLTFPGGFERVVLAGNDIPPPFPAQKLNVKSGPSKRPRSPSSLPPEPKKARQSSQNTSAGLKNTPLKTANGTNSMHKSNNAATSPRLPTVAPEKVSLVKASATDRMHMHVSMTLQLKDQPSGTTALCKVPNCGAKVTYEQLSEHFLAHETADGKDSDGPVSFPCAACGISFRYRRELDTHAKNKHGGGMTEKERLNLLSDSDSSSDEDTPDPVVPFLSNIAVSPSKTRTVPPMLLKRPSSSQSDWSVDKEAANYCNICDKTFKTTKAKNVHMATKHSKGQSGNKAKALVEEKLRHATFTPEASLIPSSESLFLEQSTTNLPGASMTVTASNWKKYGCQICTKRFNEFCQLRTHYTLYHFWDNLSEDYAAMGDKCNICMLRYPTEDHLIQHMGNFHCIIDKYLVKKGLRIISEEKTVKPRSLKCEFCGVLRNNCADLKNHLSVKHFQKQLAAEFPCERGRNKRCPKCYKTFEGSGLSAVVAHVGSFHDEVIKYAIDVLDLHPSDREKIPVDDFDDGTIGVPFDREVRSVDYKCETCGCTCETRSDLKEHYLDQHYAGHFMEKFPIPFCQFCDPPQEYHSLSVLHRHIVSKHEQVFSSVLFKDGITLPSLASPRRRKKVISKGIFDHLFCQICLQELQTPTLLKVHYIRHYQHHFQNKYFTVTCPYCEKPFVDVLTTQKHIATEHSQQSLVPLMEKENLWVNKSVILEPNSVKLKRMGIPIKKLDKSVVKKHFDDLEEEATEIRHDCVFPSCERVFEKREEFLIHLAISHFFKDMTLEFGESFGADPVHCPVCKAKINPCSEKITYYKHLAVAHETVMKYVQTIAREEPDISQPNTSRVPVIRFSNETAQDTDTEVRNISDQNRDSEIDRILMKHGASSLVNGTTVDMSEPEAPPKDTAVEVKEEVNPPVNEIMSKMRNVFESDDSDSD